jgi:Raf kinase inhibitor-like YbhB/YbcL family protein
MPPPQGEKADRIGDAAGDSKSERSRIAPATRGEMISGQRHFIGLHFAVAVGSESDPCDTVFVASTVASTSQRISSAIAGLAMLVVLTGCGAGDRERSPSPQGPTATSANPTTPAPGADPVTITSPAFADGEAIPVRYTCQADNIPPPLAWSAPSSAAELALVVDDTDAPGGLFIHWIVTGIAPGPGSTADGQTPANGHTLPNSTGNDGYFAPCPPAGSGTHHYRFTLYQLPAALQLPTGSAGTQAAQAIAQAASAQARLTGTFQR